MIAEHCYQLIHTDASNLATWCRQQSNECNTWYPYFGFQAFPLNREKVFELCPDLDRINGIAKIDSFGITKMTDNEYYRLHTDTVRGVTINMLLQQDNGVCAFADEDNKKTVHMNYQLDKLYLFNTQAPHTVLNFSGDRILFTTEFHDPKNLLPYRYLQKQLRKIQLL